jgi:hypothetical protein
VEWWQTAWGLPSGPYTFRGARQTKGVREVYDQIIAQALFFICSYISIYKGWIISTYDFDKRMYTTPREVKINSFMSLWDLYFRRNPVLCILTVCEKTMEDII